MQYERSLVTRGERTVPCSGNPQSMCLWSHLGWPFVPGLQHSAYRLLLEGLWKRMQRTGKSGVWFPNLQHDLGPAFSLQVATEGAPFRIQQTGLLVLIILSVNDWQVRGDLHITHQSAQRKDYSLGPSNNIL